MSRYVPNRGWSALALEGAGMVSLVGAKAQEVARAANDASPTAKVKFQAGGPEVGSHGPEAAVSTESSIWHIIEYGSAKWPGSVFSPAYAPMRAAVEQAGLRWEATAA